MARFWERDWPLGRFGACWFLFFVILAWAGEVLCTGGAPPPTEFILQGVRDEEMLPDVDPPGGSRRAD